LRHVDCSGDWPALALSVLPHLFIFPGTEFACVLTGHALKDPNVTVHYHKDDQGQFSNAPVEVANDLAEIIKMIR
jgi:threonine synthase